MNEKTLEMARILWLASGGGHMTELLRVQELMPEHESVFVANSCTTLPVGTRAELFTLTHRTGVSLVRNIPELWRVFRSCRPDVLVTNGAGHAVMAALVAKALGIPVFYIETGASTRTPSRTGRLMTSLRLADATVYPWEGVASWFPKGECTGPLF